MEILDYIAAILSEITVWSTNQSNQVLCRLQNFPFIPKYYFISACFLSYFPVLLFTAFIHWNKYQDALGL